MALSSLGTMIELRRGSLRLAVMILLLAIASNVGEFVYEERADPGGTQLFGGISGVVCGLFGYVWMKGLYEPEQGMILHPNSVTFGLLWIALCMTGRSPRARSDCQRGPRGGVDHGGRPGSAQVLERCAGGPSG